MLVVLTPSTVRNPRALEMTAVPKQVLGRSPGIKPRGIFPGAVFWRLTFEHSLPRYILALVPFPAAMIIWPDAALAISQAPVLMFGVVLFIESNVLSISSPNKRRALIGETDAARGLDLLAVRAREILTRVAARRGLCEGTLHLVIEQSAMARVAPLTLVSIQIEGPPAAVLDLSEAERRLVRDRMFDAGLDERMLHRINLAENRFLRSVALEARGVSAHARLSAMAGR